MRTKKHAAVCAWCRAPKRSRYRAIVDAYLCDACHAGARTNWVVPAPGEAVLAVLTPARDNAELEQFDLSHLESQ